MGFLSFSHNSFINYPKIVNKTSGLLAKKWAVLKPNKDKGFHDF